MNLFAGGRRITVLIAAAWVLGVVFVYVDDEPKGAIAYRVAYPGATPTRIVGEACVADDADRTDYGRVTEKGTPYTLRLCFAPHQFESRSLIPYKIEGSTIFGDSEFSQEVDAYTARVIREFTFPSGDESILDEERWRVLGAHVIEAFKVVAIGVAAIWGGAALIGWVLRGFLGIPAGRDTKPPSGSSD